MDPSYKARKEAFVSNLAGGSVWEINAVTLVAPVCTPWALDNFKLSLLTNSFLGFCSPVVSSPIPRLVLHALQYHSPGG